MSASSPGARRSTNPARWTMATAAAAGTAALLLLALPLESFAQQRSGSGSDQRRSFVALGAASIPEFEGSADREVLPFLAGRIDLGGAGTIRITGLGIKYDVLGGGNSAWAFGPLLSLRPERDDGVEDPVLRRLREVDAVTEAGAFVEYSFAGIVGRGDRLALGLEARAGKGAQWAITAGYLAARQGALQVGLDGQLVFATDKYMDTYFSIDADNSARSGLPQYEAESGIKNAALGLSATYDLGSDWLLLGRVGVNRLLGDASDSPIVRLRGRATSASVGIGVGWRF